MLCPGPSPPLHFLLKEYRKIRRASIPSSPKIATKSPSSEHLAPTWALRLQSGGWVGHEITESVPRALKLVAANEGLTDIKVNHGLATRPAALLLEVGRSTRIEIYTVYPWLKVASRRADAAWSESSITRSKTGDGGPCNVSYECLFCTYRTSPLNCENSTSELHQEFRRFDLIVH